MLIAGAGRSDITPPVGIAHAGWGAATHQRAEGVDMPFYATALYVTDGELEIAIVDLDVGILTNQDDSEIRTKIASISGIKPEHIRLSATHTHSGPVNRQSLVHTGIHCQPRQPKLSAVRNGQQSPPMWASAKAVVR